MRLRTYPWPFFVAMAATVLLFFSFQGFFPTLPLYIAAIGGTPADNGLATWAFALAALLTRALAGFLADRWGRKPVLVLGALLFGGAPSLYAFASDLPLLLVIRAIHGIGMALFSTTYQAFIADMLPSGRHGEGLGLANVASVATMVVAPLAGEWMSREFGFRVLFAVLGAVGGAGLVVTLMLPGRRYSGDPRLRLEKAGQTGLRQALQQPGVRAGALGMALLAVPFGAFIGFLPLLAVVRGLGATGWIFGVYALASSLVQPVAGRVADRWGSGKITSLGLMLASVAVAGLAVAVGRWAVMGLAVLFGIGGGVALAGLSASVQGSVGSTLRGSAAAVQYTAFDLIIAFGSLGLGWLAGAADYGVMYAVAGGLPLLGLAARIVGRRRRPEPGSSSTRPAS